MDVQITSRRGKVSPEMKETISQKMGRIEKFYEKITWCRCVLDNEHAGDVVEIIINTRGKTLSARAREDNLGKCVDTALAKIERQLKKENEKVKSHKSSKPVTLE